MTIYPKSNRPFSTHENETSLGPPCVSTSSSLTKRWSPCWYEHESKWQEGDKPSTCLFLKIDWKKKGVLTLLQWWPEGPWPQWKEPGSKKTKAVRITWVRHWSKRVSGNTMVTARGWGRSRAASVTGSASQIQRLLCTGWRLDGHKTGRCWTLHLKVTRDAQNFRQHKASRWLMPGTFHSTRELGLHSEENLLPKTTRKMSYLSNPGQGYEGKPSERKKCPGILPSKKNVPRKKNSRVWVPRVWEKGWKRKLSHWFSSLLYSFLRTMYSKISLLLVVPVTTDFKDLSPSPDCGPQLPLWEDPVRVTLDKPRFTDRKTEGQGHAHSHNQNGGGAETSCTPNHTLMHSQSLGLRLALWDLYLHLKLEDQRFAPNLFFF